MEFHPLCIKVIDTPEFQRLRNIRQLGLTHLVYPSAAHSRFEHSLGVCHLAGLMIDVLKKNNPSINITDEEKLCVQIAGLCHDLGHGPFSHLWEDFLRKREKVWRLPIKREKSFQHEDQSIKMFDHLLEKNDLIDDFNSFKLHEREIRFIKDLILGDGEPLDPKKQYLFQVVNNKINDIDVDKWDYYLRDGLHLNLKFSFDYTRMMNFIKIMPIPEEENKEVLVFKEKEAYSIYEMFNVRAKIHFAAAQHKVVLVLNEMLLDALCAADDHLLGG
ncbi:hypothetical protein J437_LFUL013572 [Ladona fulva]|uniref:HD domain-containing protein n=1 Tax=Ladona fulva TaxID=123851 RepID=A0A8K0KF87_LADFU|nr:hypothetical protein J437_LFUL013572 [Ladona fulva]